MKEDEDNITNIQADRAEIPDLEAYFRVMSQDAKTYFIPARVIDIAVLQSRRERRLRQEALFGPESEDLLEPYAEIGAD